MKCLDIPKGIERKKHELKLCKCKKPIQELGYDSVLDLLHVYIDEVLITQ